MDIDRNTGDKLSSGPIRYSPWSLDIEHNGVFNACKELGIPIAAYSPLGRGFLTGQLRSPDDIPEGDNRKHFDRFQVSRTLLLQRNND